MLEIDAMSNKYTGYVREQFYSPSLAADEKCISCV
jgi:hypothetical protein